LARETYLAVLDYLLTEWPLDVAIEFDEKVEALLERLQTFKNLCPPSEKQPHLRRCVVTKQTSLYYQVQGDVIEIVVFYDNRAEQTF
jgi:plasmid stabilization system protein ParE